ncbi:hypothetical protein BC828DRAFT_394324 [Blastocladiella britannica]|nr:hypothetical protein BC828DRAFT_394324 [Blastocladiella britannica]
MNNATAPIQPAAGGAGGGKGDTSSSSTASAASTSTTTSATVSSSTTTKASSTSSSAKASPTTGSGGGLRKRASPIGGSSWPVAPVAPQYAVLYTPPTYALGSSLTHVANVQPGGPDFLLRPVTQTGTALVQLTAANNPPAAVAVAVDAKTTLADALTKSKLSPVGPGTLRMLDALGYTVMPGFGMTPSTHSWFESAEPEWAEVKPSAGRCSSSWMSAAS